MVARLEPARTGVHEPTRVPWRLEPARTWVPEPTRASWHSCRLSVKQSSPLPAATPRLLLLPRRASYPPPAGVIPQDCPPVRYYLCAALFSTVAEHPTASPTANKVAKRSISVLLAISSATTSAGCLLQLVHRPRWPAGQLVPARRVRLRGLHLTSVSN